MRFLIYNVLVTFSSCAGAFENAPIPPATEKHLRPLLIYEIPKGDRINSANGSI